MARRKRLTDFRVDIKPLSVNQCWQGRRYKTKKYSEYERVLMNMLPTGVYIPPRGNLQLHIVFGFSNSSSDWDNGIKPFQDILQKRYGFNDKRVYRALVEKVITKKGDEFIYVSISKYSRLDLFFDKLKEWWSEVNDD